MPNDEQSPYRSKVVNDSVATLSLGVRPSFFRYARHDSSLKLLSWASAIVLGLGAVTCLGGILLDERGGVAHVLGTVLIVLGFLVVLLGVGIAALTSWVWRHMATFFENGLLTPGMVVSEEPPVLAALAEMGNGWGETYYGLRRLDLAALPLHDPRPETRVPCISTFQAGDAADHWAWFEPVPVSFGTGDEGHIEEALRRLEDEPFRRLKTCIRRGDLPDNDEEVVLLDERLQVLDRLRKPRRRPAEDEG